MVVMKGEATGVQHDERWIATHDALVLVVGGDAAHSRPETDPEGKAKIPGFIVIICVFVGVLGVAMMVGAATSILDGDLSSMSTSRRTGWITPPIAFFLGVALALSPIAIIRQERRTPRGTPGGVVERSVLSLQVEGVFIQEGPSAGVRPWDEVTAPALDSVPPTGRAVVQHYLDHPEHRSELGTPAAQRRAESLS